MPASPQRNPSWEDDPVASTRDAVVDEPPCEANGRATAARSWPSRSCRSAVSSNGAVTRCARPLAKDPPEPSGVTCNPRIFVGRHARSPPRRPRATQSSADTHCHDGPLPASHHASEPTPAHCRNTPQRRTTRPPFAGSDRPVAGRKLFRFRGGLGERLLERAFAAGPAGDR